MNGPVIDCGWLRVIGWVARVLVGDGVNGSIRVSQLDGGHQLGGLWDEHLTEWMIRALAHHALGFLSHLG